MYRCTNDRFCADADTFATVQDFQAMCVACFGGAAELTRDGDNWHDEQGTMTLELVADIDGILDALNAYDGSDWYGDIIAPAMTDADGRLWEQLVGDRGDRAVALGRLIELDGGDWTDTGAASATVAESALADLDLPEGVEVEVESSDEDHAVVRITALVDTDAGLMEVDELVGEALEAAGLACSDSGSLGQFLPSCHQGIHAGIFSQWVA